MFKDRDTPMDRLYRAAALGVGFLGVVLFANIFVGLWLQFRQPQQPEPGQGGPELLTLLLGLWR
jgi:hypothetical protein